MNHPTWMEHDGMDYSCCYRVIGSAKCVIEDCAATTERASLWRIGIAGQPERTAWIPLCEQHEPRPQDSFMGEPDDDDDQGSD